MFYVLLILNSPYRKTNQSRLKKQRGAFS
jgi:hypothetical protein